jgi:hypothetical protein
MAEMEARMAEAAAEAEAEAAGPAARMPMAALGREMALRHWAAVALEPGERSSSCKERRCRSRPAVAVSLGTLAVANGATGLGSGNVQVNGGTLSVSSGVVANRVLVAGGNYDVAVANGASLSGVANASSDFAHGIDTAVSLLAGTSAADIALETTFQTSSGALNDAIRESDIYSLDGTGNVPLVLQLSIGQLSGDSFLASFDSATNEWINAVVANTGNTASGNQLGYDGSFTSFQTTYGTNLDGYMGAYGVDTSTGSAWAVVDHTGSFSLVPVPEPVAATIAIPLRLGLLVASRRRLRKALSER